MISSKSNNDFKIYLGQNCLECDLSIIFAIYLKLKRMFSKACTYGISAVIYIATQSLDGKRLKIHDVATYSGSPEAFTAKILGKLNKAEIINSYKGPHGGFEMDIQKIQSTKL